MSIEEFRTGDGEESKDQELAAFTDALLEGNLSDDRPPLAGTVEVLARTLKLAPLPAGLRRKVRQRVAAEWTQHRSSTFNRLRQSFFTRPRVRWTALAVATLIVVALAAALFVPSNTDITGTAIGGTETATLLVTLALAAILIGILVVTWRISRK